MKWFQGQLETAKDDFKTVEVPVMELLNSPITPKGIIARPIQDELISYLDINDVVDPNLGKIFNRFSKAGYSEKAKTMIQDIVKAEGEYKVQINMFHGTTERGDGWMTTSVTPFSGDDRPLNAMEKFVSQNISKLPSSFNYYRVGFAGRNAEMQFLSESGRKEVKVGDFIDPGLFMHFTPDKRYMTVGFNRLVCTNGLTRRLSLFEADGLGTFDLEEYSKDIDKLFQWFEGTTKRKVESTREIAIALEHYVPKRTLKKHWKSWAERIDLKELTYFDVIDDVTREANNNLGGARYASLTIADHIERADSHGRCPVCSSHSHSNHDNVNDEETVKIDE